MTAFSNFFNKLGEQKRVRVHLLGGKRDVMYLDIRDVGWDGFMAVDPHTAGEPLVFVPFSSVACIDAVMELDGESEGVEME